MAKEKFNGREFIRDFMCKPARFCSYMERVHGEDRNRTWKRWGVEERHGWIVGATWLKTGIIHPASGGYRGFLEYDDFEPARFEETAPRLLVYKVAPWPTAKPLYVLPEDVTVIPEDELDGFNPSAWDAASRELASQWSKDYPRDDDGKWMPENKPAEAFE